MRTIFVSALLALGLLGSCTPLAQISQFRDGGELGPGDAGPNPQGTDGGTDAGGYDAGGPWVTTQIYLEATEPAFIGLTGSVDSGAVFVTTGHRLYRVRTDPLMPNQASLVGTVEGSSLAEQGTTVYIAAGTDGLKVCTDCSNASVIQSVALDSTPQSPGVTGVCATPTEAFVMMQNVSSPANTGIWRKRGVDWQRIAAGTNVSFGTACAINSQLALFVGSDSTYGFRFLPDGGVTSSNETISGGTADDRQFISVAPRGDHFLLGTDNGFIFERVTASNYFVKVRGIQAGTATDAQKVTSLAELEGTGFALAATTILGGTHLRVSGGTPTAVPYPSGAVVKAVWAESPNRYYIAGLDQGADAGAVWKIER